MAHFCWWSARVAAGTALILTIGLNQELFGAAEVSEDVRQRLNENALQLSPLHVAWVLQIVLNDNNPAWLTVPAPINAGVREPQEVDFFLDAGKFRFSEIKTKGGVNADGKPTQRTQRVGKNVAFDGDRVYQSGVRTVGSKDGIQSVSIRSAATMAAKMPDSPMLLYNYLEFAGFWLPNRCAQLTTPAVRSAVLQALSDGRLLDKDEQLSGGENLQVLTIAVKNLIYKYYLDPRLNFAVRRSETRTAKGDLIHLVELSDFRKLSNTSDLFLPWKCDVVIYQLDSWPPIPASKPLGELKFVVKEMERGKATATQFVLDYAHAGTFVSDATIPGAEQTKSGFITYEYPADAAELDQVIQEAITGVSHPSPRKVSWFFLSLNIIVIIIILAIIVWRRRTIAGN